MTDTAIRTLEYEASVRDQELANLRLRVVQLESAAGFVVRRAELATSESLRERIEALGKVLEGDPSCLDCPCPVGFHDDRGRCTTIACECPRLKDSRAESPWLAPRTVDQVRDELRRVHANNWHLTRHYEYARGYANGLHRAVSEIDNMLARQRLTREAESEAACMACEVDEVAHDTYGRKHTCNRSHAPECDSFDFDPEKQLGPDKPCSCSHNQTESVASCECRPLLDTAVNALENIASGEAGDEQAHDWPEFYESLKRDARSALDEIEAKEACTAMSQLRYAGRELIDAIVSPKGRDFSHAWKEACLFFGRFGDEPTLLAKLLRVAEAARLYVADDDEDRVQTWDAMVDAIDAALDALPPMPISSATEPSSTEPSK